MATRSAQLWISARQSLFAALIGAFLYSCIGNTMVRGQRAIEVHGYFRWPNLSTTFELALVFTPIAFPTAAAMIALLYCVRALERRRIVVHAIIATAVFMPALVIVFPWYMAALLSGSNWHRWMLLPGLTSAAAIALWLYDIISAPAPRGDGVV